MKKKTLIIVIGVFLFIHLLNAQTWEEAKRLTWTSGSSNYSAIAVDSNNHLHVVWQDNTTGDYEIYYKKSTDAGESWIAEKRITWTSGDSEEPAIAVDSYNHLHLVFYDDRLGNSEIYYKKSTNGGASWLKAKRLTWNSGSSVVPAIAMDSSNAIYVVWSDDSRGNYEIYYKKSTNGGASWLKAKRLTWNSGYSYHPSIAVDTNNNVHLFWQDNTLGNYNIYYKKSTNGGATWTGKRITWSKWARRPDIAIDSNNHIHVVWLANVVDSLVEIFYKKSTNGGATWTGKRITWLYLGEICGLLDPAIAVDSNNHLHVVFEVHCPGTTGYHDVYYKKSTDGGMHWTKVLGLAGTVGDIYRPDIAIDSNNNIHVVWEHRDADSADSYEIYYAKGIQ
jgi:hypothetical protein